MQDPYDPDKAHEIMMGSQSTPYEVKAHLENEDGEITSITRVFGVDFGGRIEILHQSGDFAVGKVNGHPSWAGIGRRRWVGTEYMLLHILRDEGKIAFLIMKREAPGHNWKSVETKLAVAMTKLAESI